MMYKVKLIGLGACCLLLVLGFVSQAHASPTIIIFNNFGPGHSASDHIGWAVDGPAVDVDTPFTPAMGFMPSVTATLSQIDFAIGYLVGATHSVTLTLNQDASGVPGAVIQSWTVISLPNFGPTVFDTVLGSGETLTAGNLYWLVATAPSDTQDAWNFNTVGDIGPKAFSTDGGGTWNPANVVTTTRGAFDVLGVGVPSAIPEPASMILFGTGLVMVGGILRRRRSKSNPSV